MKKAELEKIFDAIAGENMIQFEVMGFNRTYPTLKKCIVKSLTKAYNLGLENAAEQVEGYDIKTTKEAILALKLK